MRNEKDDFILSDMIAEVLNIDELKSKSKYAAQGKSRPKMNTIIGLTLCISSIYAQYDYSKNYNTKYSDGTCKVDYDCKTG